MKDIVEKEAKEEKKQEKEEDINLTPQEHERALNGAYRRNRYQKQILIVTLNKLNHTSRR